MAGLTRARVGAALRRVDGRLPASLRRGARGAVRRALRRERPPLVTVVVTASDEDVEYVEECLASVREQTHIWLDILVSPHGPARRVVEAARRHQREDCRLRILRASAPSRPAAREVAGRVARGEYLVFVRGSDLLPSRAVELGVESLEASGSDLVVGRVRDGRTLNPTVVTPYDPAHVQNRRSTTLADSPMAITDVTVGNRLFRTRFWRDSGLRFPGVDGGEADVALAAYTKATRFDLLQVDTYTDMDRGRGTPLEQRFDPMPDLLDWIEGQRLTFQRLLGLADTGLRDGWIFGVLERGVPRFLDEVERADSVHWAALREYATELVEVMDDAVWQLVSAEQRVKLQLLLGDRRDLLERFVAARWFERGNRPTQVREGRVFAVLPGYGDADWGVGEDWYEMHPSETRLQTLLRNIRWISATVVELELLSYVDLVDYAEPPELAVFVVEERSGRRVALEPERRPDDQANFTIAHTYQDYAPGGYRVRLDITTLVAQSAGVVLPEDPRSRALWHLEVTVRTRGLERTGTVTRLDGRGSAGLLASAHLAPRVVDRRLVNTSPEPGGGLVLRVAPPPRVQAEEIAVEGRTVTFRLTGAAATRLVATRRGHGRVAAAVDAQGRCRLELPAVRMRGPEDPPWQLRVELRAGGTAPVHWPTGRVESLLPVRAGAGVVPARSWTGVVDLFETTGTLLLEEIRLESGAIALSGRWVGPAAREAEVRMRGRVTSPVAALRTDRDRRVEARLATYWKPWQLHRVRIPGDEYLFELSADGRPGRLLVTDELVHQMVRFEVDEDFRLRRLRNGPHPGVYLAPPNGPSAWGALQQQRLQDAARSCAEPIDPHAVYLQSYVGASATDSQLAIHHELRRARPELTLYWGVLDGSSWVPEGGVPVLMRSPEWYRVLATSRYLVSNIDFDRWFRKRPGQTVLQTFHGYPAKSMGIRMWAAKNFTEGRIGAELDRTARGWDLILTPAPEMDEHYRREYRYDGAIHSAGYPRDDVLVGPDAERIRRETRARLGIAEGQTAVLYAPTWRDNAATNYRSARMVQHLDVVSASRALGPEYVLLMRGHRFHAKGAERSRGTARLLDVTDYPEINDLILAADAAVLDYSSLRFDFALTERPMLFLVPDLEDYTTGIRGFLYPYTDSAPGPLLADAEDVVARLRDLPGLRREYTDEIADFNKRFNYLQDGHAAERVVEAFFGPADGD